MHAIRALFTAFFLTLLLTNAVAASQPRLGLHVAPCTQGKSKVPAMCGTMGVYENRSTRTGRIISLGVIVLKAKHPSHHAIAFIAGGPGELTTPFAEYVADGQFEPALSALRDRYDIVFADDRGMGLSNPFQCRFAPPGDPAAYFRQLWPDRVITACRARNLATHDPSQYNTNNTVDDLDELRAALGYPKLVLNGGSYGTTFSLVYMRRHPRSVESAVLLSVAPPHFMPLPGSPDGAQTAFDELNARCRRDPVCHRNFPDFAQHFGALIRRFDGGPISVPAKNLATKHMQTVALSKEVFVDQTRHVLYDPEPSAYLPYIVEHAYRKDYAPLGKMIEFFSLQFSNDLDAAANLSYTCADWMPFVDPAQVRWAAQHSFAGDLRIRAQRRACAIWNVPAMPRSFNDIVRSDLPVLMIATSNDPGTPSKYGEEALHYLPNGREALLQGGGHSVQTPCTDRLVLQFISKGSAKDLNVTKCRSAFKFPPFMTSMKGWPSL